MLWHKRNQGQQNQEAEVLQQSLNLKHNIASASDDCGSVRIVIADHSNQLAFCTGAFGHVRCWGGEEIGQGAGENGDIDEAELKGVRQLYQPLTGSRQ